MIIEEYFNPVDKKYIPKATHNDCWVNKAAIYQTELPEIDSGKIALIGITENEKDNFAGLVRKQLYTYSKSEYAQKIIDLGDFNYNNDPKTAEKLGFILSELHEKNVYPLLISPSQEIAYCQYLAFDFLKKIINMAVIDSRIDFSLENQDIFENQNYLYKVLLKDPSYLFNLSFIAYQTYLTNTEVISFMENYFFDMYRLGVARENIKDIEPIIRSSDIVNFNLSAIRYADSPSSPNASPNGLYAEEACQLARYCGLSDTTSSFSLTSYKFNDKNIGQTACVGCVFGLVHTQSRQVSNTAYRVLIQ